MIEVLSCLSNNTQQCTKCRKIYILCGFVLMRNKQRQCKFISDIQGKYNICAIVRFILYSLCTAHLQSQSIQTVPISCANISQHAEQTADWHEQSHTV